MAVTMARLPVGARNAFHGLASPLPAAAIALARAELSPPTPTELDLLRELDPGGVRYSEFH